MYLPHAIGNIGQPWHSKEGITQKWHQEMWFLGVHLGSWLPHADKEVYVKCKSMYCFPHWGNITTKTKTEHRTKNKTLDTLENVSDLVKTVTPKECIL